MRRSEGEGAGHRDSTSLVNICVVTLTNYGGWGGWRNFKVRCSEVRWCPPPIALWYSWFYISCKSDRAMIHLIEENWQHLLVMFWKLSLRWRKRLQLKSWIDFGKSYHSSSHITHKTWIKGRSVSNINQDGGVDTQQVHQWYGNGIDGYIRLCSQQRGLIPILKDWYLPMRECMKRIADWSLW